MAFNVASPGRLFGRYWGAVEEHPFLHFNVALYHSVEECIRLGRQVFEGGAGGDHKLARGFEPAEVWSAHHFLDRRLDGPSARHLAEARGGGAGGARSAGAPGRRCSGRRRARRPQVSRSSRVQVAPPVRDGQRPRLGEQRRRAAPGRGAGPTSERERSTASSRSGARRCSSRKASAARSLHPGRGEELATGARRRAGAPSGSPGRGGPRDRRRRGSRPGAPRRPRRRRPGRAGAPPRAPRASGSTHWRASARRTSVAPPPGSPVSSAAAWTRLDRQARQRPRGAGRAWPRPARPRAPRRPRAASGRARSPVPAPRSTDRPRAAGQRREAVDQRRRVARPRAVVGRQPVEDPPSPIRPPRRRAVPSPNLSTPPGADRGALLDCPPCPNRSSASAGSRSATATSRRSTASTSTWAGGDPGAARPQRRRQDHPHQHRGRAGPGQRRGGAACWGATWCADYRFTRRAVGLVPQEINFDPFFTVEETLHFQAGYFGVRLAAERLEEILEALDLTEKRHANTRSLSGGMKRRLLIGKALVHEPPRPLPRRAHRRRGREAAAAALGLRAPPAGARHHHRAHHPLPRGGRGAGRPGGGDRPRPDPARGGEGAAPASGRAARPCASR